MEDLFFVVICFRMNLYLDGKEVWQFKIFPVSGKKEVNEYVKENYIPDRMRVQCERTFSQQCDF